MLLNAELCIVFTLCEHKTTACTSCLCVQAYIAGYAVICVCDICVLACITVWVCMCVNAEDCHFVFPKKAASQMQPSKAWPVEFVSLKTSMAFMRRR